VIAGACEQRKNAVSTSAELPRIARSSAVIAPALPGTQRRAPVGPQRGEARERAGDLDEPDEVAGDVARPEILRRQLAAAGERAREARQRRGGEGVELGEQRVAQLRLGRRVPPQRQQIAGRRAVCWLEQSTRATSD
jgi:hypothetical protein